MTRQRLYINIDHIATVRQARRGAEPVPAEAVPICERAGADGITAHLREDRRHIQDADIDSIAAVVTSVLNLEIACTPEMLDLAARLRPHQVTLVPERREEVTTEGGLALAPAASALRAALDRLRDSGIRTSLFIDPDRDSVSRSRDLGADAIELHTGRYAHAPGEGPAVPGAGQWARELDVADVSDAEARETATPARDDGDDVVDLGRGRRRGSGGWRGDRGSRRDGRRASGRRGLRESGAGALDVRLVPGGKPASCEHGAR